MILAEDTLHGRYLIFALGKESFGLEIACVTEIVGMQTVTCLPDAPSYVKGVVNLRGKVIPVMDMRLRFGKESSVYTDRTCIIIADIRDVSIGLIVDNVTEVLTIDDDQIVPPPPTMVGLQNKYLKAIGKVGSDVKLLLDGNRLWDMNALLTLKMEGTL